MDRQCSHCEPDEYIIKVTKFWHRITPGLVKTLVKVYKRVCEKNQNLVFMNELDLNHSEYGNFQKLRFHALIAKYRKNGQIVHSTWVITKRGADLLKGGKIPEKVQTLLNRVMAHTDNLVSLTDIMRSEVDFETYEDFKKQAQLPLVEFAEPEENIDNLKTVVSKKRKGKKYCKNCNIPLKMLYLFNKVEPLALEEFEPDKMIFVNDVKVKVKKLWKCTNCNFTEEV